VSEVGPGTGISRSPGLAHACVQHRWSEEVPPAFYPLGCGMVRHGYGFHHPFPRLTL